MVLSQTSVEGIHLVQDPATRRWETIKCSRPSAFVGLKRRFFELVKARTTFKTNIAIAFSACALGVAITISLSWAPMNTGKNQIAASTLPVVVIKAGLPIEPPRQQTTSIAVAADGYVEKIAESKVPLPPSINQQVPPAAIPEPMPAPVWVPSVGQDIAANPKLPSIRAPVVTTVKSLPQTQIANGDDSNSMSVFNEALPSLKSTTSISQLAAPVPAAPVQATQSARVVQPTKAAQQATIRILAIPVNNSVVITDPSTRLPVVVKVGEVLPDGSVLKSADKATSTAVTSRGESISLQ